MADSFGPDLGQLPRSIINGQCSSSSGSTDFSFWLRSEVPAMAEVGPVFPQVRTFKMAVPMVRT
jgi:hypothetical protein